MQVLTVSESKCPEGPEGRHSWANDQGLRCEWCRVAMRTILKPEPVTEVTGSCPSCDREIAVEYTTWEDACYHANSDADRQKWFRINTHKCPECGACGGQDDFGC